MANQERLLLKISGMHCASCVSTIEKGLSRLEGVRNAQVNLAMNSAVVDFDPSRLDDGAIIGAISKLGYSAAAGRPDILTSNEEEFHHARDRFYLAAALTLPLMLVAMLPMLMTSHAFLLTETWDACLEGALAAAVVFWAGRSILSDAWKQTRRFHANMNSLIAIGTLAAFLWSLYATVLIIQGRPEGLYYDSAGMIVTLILLGRYLEAKSKGRAGQAIQALLKLRPTKATAIFNNVEFEVDATTVRSGMILVVKPGERIAADGVILDGTPTLDESMLTGESVPVDRREGDMVVGGSLNGNRPFKMKVTTAGDTSYLATIIRMVTEAQSKKAPIQALADRVAGVFVPIVIVIAILTAIVWSIAAPDSPMMIKSVISILIIACPCALGLATPTAVLVGTGRAARGGILFRGGDILEKLSHVDAILFDKTGTLTHGQLELVDLQPVGSFTPKKLRGFLFAVESKSEHPVAEAIVRSLRGQEMENIPVSKVQAKPGYGISARAGDFDILIGSEDFLSDSRVDLGPAQALIESHKKNGRTIAIIAVDGVAIGFAALADKVRPEAAEVVAKLSRSHRLVSMISGDSKAVAGQIAQELGLKSFEAEIRPEQKRDIVVSYRSRGYKVAMVGDGINDAPALAAADVGIAMGSGTDVAMESADVVLLRPDIRILDHAIRLSRNTLGVIKQNLFWAFFYNIIAIPIAAGLFYPVAGWTLSPMIAAAAMSCSSLFVVLNSLRLSRMSLT